MKTRKKLKFILTILLIIGLAVWVLFRMPFYTHVNQTIKATVYIDGEQTETTSIEVNGSKSNYLFRDKQKFIGSLCIQAYEKTCREDMSVGIKWDDYSNSQRVLYMQNGTFPTLKLRSELFVNATMDKFALGFKDGMVIATSEKMYHRYINNFQIHK